MTCERPNLDIETLSSPELIRQVQNVIEARKLGLEDNTPQSYIDSRLAVLHDVASPNNDLLDEVYGIPKRNFPIMIPHDMKNDIRNNTRRALFDLRKAKWTPGSFKPDPRCYLNWEAMDFATTRFIDRLIWSRIIGAEDNDAINVDTVLCAREIGLPDSTPEDLIYQTRSQLDDQARKISQGDYSEIDKDLNVAELKESLIMFGLLSSEGEVVSYPSALSGARLYCRTLTPYSQPPQVVARTLVVEGYKIDGEQVSDEFCVQFLKEVNYELYAELFDKPYYTTL